MMRKLVSVGAFMGANLLQSVDAVSYDVPWNSNGSTQTPPKYTIMGLTDHLLFKRASGNTETHPTYVHDGFCSESTTQAPTTTTADGTSTPKGIELFANTPTTGSQTEDVIGTRLGGCGQKCVYCNSHYRTMKMNVMVTGCTQTIDWNRAAPALPPQEKSISLTDSLQFVVADGASHTTYFQDGACPVGCTGSISSPAVLSSNVPSTPTWIRGFTPSIGDVCKADMSDFDCERNGCVWSQTRPAAPTDAAYQLGNRTEANSVSNAANSIVGTTFGCGQKCLWSHTSDDWATMRTTLTVNCVVDWRETGGMAPPASLRMPYTDKLFFWELTSGQSTYWTEGACPAMTAPISDPTKTYQHLGNGIKVFRGSTFGAESCNEKCVYVSGANYATQKFNLTLKGCAAGKDTPELRNHSGAFRNTQMGLTHIFAAVLSAIFWYLMM